MDTPESLAADMLRAATEAIVATRAVVQKGALNIKTEAKANVLKSAPVHNAHAAQAITYDTTIGASTVDAEIGYDKDRNGGSLGNLLEYGSRKNSPHRDLGRALDAEDPRFEQAIAAAIEKLL
jgi:hypothetical protein